MILRPGYPSCRSDGPTSWAAPQWRPFFFSCAGTRDGVCSGHDGVGGDLSHVAGHGLRRPVRQGDDDRV
jgi:hypothetical protein